MKKVTLLCLVLIFIFSNVVSAKGYDSNLNSKKYEYLEALGYDASDDELFTKKNVIETNNDVILTGEDLERFYSLGYSFDQVKDFSENELAYLSGIEGEILGVDVAYVKEEIEGQLQKINKDEYVNGVNEYLAAVSICSTSSSTCIDEETSTNWMKLTTSIARVSGTTPQEYIIVHSYEWTKKPYYTYKDAVGVAHPVSMTPVQNSEYLMYSADKYESNNLIIGLGPFNFKNVSTNYVWSANDKTGGMAFEFPMLKDYVIAPQIGYPEQVEYRNHRGTLAYRATRSNSSYTSATISGHYIHTETSYSGSLGVSVDGLGMSISASVTKTPAIETGVSFNF